MRPGCQTLFERRDGEVQVEYARDLGATGERGTKTIMRCCTGHVDSCALVGVILYGGVAPNKCQSELRLLAMRASSEDRGGRME